MVAQSLIGMAAGLATEPAERVAESKLPNKIAQTCLRPTPGRIQPVTVITGAANASEPAYSVDIELVMRQVGPSPFR
ncbi:hypothetical protein MesoLj131b_73110 (plasmid) [Mesorhizobium sp. 131-2-5]|nr:hypothetical protein MesoLj131b_73110 [Mesorhizobium sp. 131-2-5]